MEKYYELSLEYQVDYNLTEAETRVLQQLLLGKSDQDIADALGNSEKTIKNHVSHIKQKMGCTSRAHILAKVIQKLLDK